MKRLIATVLSTFAVLTLSAQFGAIDLIQVKKLNEVSVSGTMKVILIQGEQTGYAFEGGMEAAEGIQVIEEKGRLTITKESDATEGENTTLYVFFKKLKEFMASGNAVVTSFGQIEDFTFKINASGNSQITLNLLVDRLECDLYSQAVVTVRGRGEKQTIRVNGFAKYLAGAFKTQTAYVTAKTNAEAKVYVDRELRTSGNGTVGYLGNPSSVNGANASRY